VTPCAVILGNVTTPASGPAPAGTPGDDPDPVALLRLATSLAAGASALMVEALASRAFATDTKSTPTDMVTEVDRAAEALIVAGIRDARPDDTIVGEEGADVVGTNSVRWVVDPIDGTTNFVYGHPGFSVSIAVEVAGTTVTGVVAVPLLHEVFTAIAGQGARRNGEPISVGGVAQLDRALVATGFSYDAGRRLLQSQVLTRVLPHIRDIRRMGAASVDLCSVACGRVDAYYERGLQPWDYAAGALVAREAGAVVGDLDGGGPTPAFVLASNPALFGPLAALLSEAGARDA
jgi:myo-inositol-1(or 4)-monophosphatase